jgi:hypothetical protein
MRLSKPRFLFVDFARAFSSPALNTAEAGGGVGIADKRP